MVSKIDSTIKSLPSEMLAEILRHAVSNSLTDFANASLSCKDFLKASNYNYVFENVSMDKLDFVPWRKSEKVFLNRCKHAKNAEALYRKGMLNCFSRKKPESGLRYLKRAAEKGHPEAMYTYGLILICLGGDQLKKQGLKVVSGLNLTTPAKRSFKIANYRSKTNKFLCNMWVHVALTTPKESAGGCNCDDNTPKLDCLSSEDKAWEASNNFTNNLPCCDSCFWNREAIFFSSTVREFLIN